MTQKFSQKQSVLFLAFIEMFERFSYYGMRAIITLYAIDENGLGLSPDNTYAYYGMFTMAISLSFLPMGILSDKILKQKNGVQIGALLQLIGYSLLLFNRFELVVAGLVFIVLGVSLFKPNIIVLEGMLFEKSDKRRVWGFTVFYMSINIGAFVSIIGIGYVGVEYSWILGFSIVTVIMFIVHALFYFYKNRLNLIEEIDKEKQMIEWSDAPNISDEIALEKKSHTSEKFPHTNFASRIKLIVIVSFIGFCYWTFYDFTIELYYDFIKTKVDFGFSFQGLLYSLNSIFSLIIGGIFSVFWYRHEVGKTLPKLIITLVVLGISILLFSPIVPVSLPTSLVSLLCLSIGEFFIITVLMSYLTRLSPLQYASTIIGAYLTFIYFAFSLFEKVTLLIDKTQLILPVGVLIIVLGGVAWLSQPFLSKLANGID